MLKQELRFLVRRPRDRCGGFSKGTAGRREHAKQVGALLEEVVVQVWFMRKGSFLLYVWSI